ncbi:MAG: transglycosylase SLT domain-containing protein [Paludibacteraceae bacterium]|nr:transglycosylase SLT domain-containing protein [Paludibacteraceae bacterium]
MSKKIIYILFLIFSCGSIVAQEAIDTLNVESDLLSISEADSSLLFFSDSISDSLVVSQTIAPLPFDTILHNYFLEKAFQIDCERTDSGAVYYSDSVYMARLQSLPHVMEMTYNKVVKSCIERYARCPKDVGYMLGIGNTYYFPMFEEALERHNVPLELKYLPVIESALNAKAKSPVGAMGLWQFMVGTGKIYGLEVNSMVDERRDPRKASDAAARYLADLYKRYNDWHLVIAAYNCGPGNVSKAIRIANGKQNFWEIYPYLPRETRSYVPLFIAANYIMNFYEHHNMCPATPLFNYATDTVMISDRVHLQQIAEKVGISLDELKFLNPQYRYDIIPGNIKPYPLVVPFEHVNSYALNRDSILAHKPELAKREIKFEPSEGEVVYYKVKSGDTLGGIAKKYRVSVKNLQKWNKLSSTTIHIGQKLRIYK